MAFKPQIKVPATYMRGGTSKGVFFNLTDLPEPAQVAGEARDNLLLRVIGSPDPYQKQTDGMGGATSSTSKTVILSKSDKPAVLKFMKKYDSQLAGRVRREVNMKLETGRKNG